MRKNGKPRSKVPKSHVKSKRVTARRVKVTGKPYDLPDAPLTIEVDEDAVQPDGLTPRQRLFVLAYCGPSGFNATQAAVLAGYRDDNYNSLKVTAHHTLHKPLVQAAIAREMTKGCRGPEWVENRLTQLAQSNMANFLKPTEDGKSVVLDMNQAAAVGAYGQIREIKEEVIQVGDGPAVVIKRTIRIHDPKPALETLARRHGMLKDNVEHTGEVKFHPITLDGDKEIADE